MRFWFCRSSPHSSSSSSSRGFEIADAAYEFPREKYEPLAGAYGSPLISFKAATWPVYPNLPAKTTRLFDCSVAIYPLW